jgi:hypothetical protein
VTRARALRTGLAALFSLLAAARDAAGAGRPCGSCFVPPEARAVDTSNPDHVIGTGTPASCTSAAVVSTIALGGIITFDCGPAPVTIVLTQTAKIYNDTGPVIVIDGGGLVTLDGGGARRILYMNTCDPDLVWTTDHCDNQDHPRLTLQNLTFARGNSTGATPDGGGAVFARGGRLKVINSRFQDNVCDPSGPDVGGAALRAFDQYNDLPLYIVRSTFGGAGHGNSCSNGGALSAIGVSYTVLNSVISHNDAIGNGANPPRPGTPGGGSGGGIYNDGNTFHLRICGSTLHDNHANEGGGGVFFVSNNLGGTLTVQDSYIWNCPSDGFWTMPWPWLFYLGMGNPQITGTSFDGPPPDLFCDGFESQGFQIWSSSSP